MIIDKLISGGKALAGGLLCCLALTACLRDNVDSVGGGADESGEQTYGLAFAIAADALTSVDASGEFRYGDENENYIDPSLLRVLFLDKEGNFKFEMSNYDYPGIKSGLRLEPLRMTNGNAVAQWFIRIPIDLLSDEELRLITDEGFKIAVLANWPDDTFWGDPEQANINTNFLLEGTEQNIAKRLAHCHRDDQYVSTEDIYNSYKPFLGIDNKGNYNQMSVSMDWIKLWYTEDDQVAAAEKDIRTTFRPYPGDNERPSMVGRSGRTYYNMWYVWNFGGTTNAEEQYSSQGYYDTEVADIRQAWIERNDAQGWGPVLQERVKSPVSKEENVYGIEGVTLYKGADNVGTDEHDGVILASKSNANSNYTAIVTPDGLGFSMPRMTAGMWKRGDSSCDHEAGKKLYEQITDAQVKNHETNSGFGYLKIPLAADGTLRFKVAALCGGSDGSNPHNVAIGIHYGSNSSFDTPEGLASNAKKRYTYDVCVAADNNTLSEVQVIDFPVAITERVQDAYIYALCENTNDRLVIYEIEYIKSEHLADVERDGVAPSKKQPIPMYGIQDFDPIGEYWTPGEMFNLSAYSGSRSNQYNYKWISLLRSVAKVELKIAKAPFHGKQPAYLYMRSMNRTARLNPIDVLTPTNEIWYGSSGAAGIVQETKNINAYGPMYEELKESDPQKALTRFHNRLAWFFGIWNDETSGIGWNWNDEPITVNSQFPAPRVFNPHINRSDYTHFIYLGDDSEYWYYSLYVPEKHLTDANDPGDLSNAPKCLRVEMRFEGVNDDSNLDDNASYRIYFVDTQRLAETGGNLSGIYNRDDYENVTSTPGMPYETAFENDLKNLRAFYPIVRNHVYQITVSGINSGDVKISVSEPQNRNVEIEFD